MKPDSWYLGWPHLCLRYYGGGVTLGVRVQVGETGTRNRSGLESIRLIRIARENVYTIDSSKARTTCLNYCLIPVGRDHG